MRETDDKDASRDEQSDLGEERPHPRWDLAEKGSRTDEITWKATLTDSFRVRVRVRLGRERGQQERERAEKAES